MNQRENFIYNENQQDKEARKQKEREKAKRIVFERKGRELYLKTELTIVKHTKQQFYVGQEEKTKG
jgi:hypothetical protein